MISKGKCGKKCEKACQKGAINFADQETEEVIDVGSIIAAAGFQLWDAGIATEYGYGRFDNVVTSTYLLTGAGEVRVCAGGYAEAKKLEKAVKAEKAERAEKAAPPSTPPPQPPQAPRKLNNRETRELEALPGKMETLEAEIAEIESTLADPSIYAKDNARAVALTARLSVARAELDAAETRWLELSERA